MRFLIAALPRSRTAWCAAYFSSLDKTFCHHELLKRCDNIYQFKDRMDPRHQISAMGNADCALPLVDVKKILPGAQVVKIWRPFFEVCKSLMKLDIPISADTVHMLDRRMHLLPGMDVDYSELDDKMPQICTYLGLPYDEDLHDVFRNLNVQTTDYEPVEIPEWISNP